MLLPVPVVGVDPGPDYANNINSCMSLIDAHNHASGSGVQITPSGMNINSDLSLNGNNLILSRSVRFSPQSVALSGASDLGCLYEAGVDLYYNDGSGNQIRITQSGSVAGSSGTITGLPSGTASAAYSSGSQTFIFQSATNTAANLDGRSVILRNSSVSSSGLTLSAPTLSGNYSLTLPAIPGTTSIMALDTSGNITAPYTVDNATLIISSNQLQVNSLGIQTGNIANNAVTRAKLASVGQQISSSSGAFSDASALTLPVTNLSVTITTTGRPVMVMMQPDATSNPADFIYINNAGTAESPNYYIYRNGSPLVTYVAEAAAHSFIFPPYPMFLDTPSAGTYTYKIYINTIVGAATFQVNYMVLVAYEL